MAARKKAKKAKVVKRKRAPAVKSTTSYAYADKPTAGLGVIVLLLNALVLPGLGSLIGRRINAGLIQLILAILGQLFLGKLIHSQIALGFTGLGVLSIVGIVLVLLSWVWGIVTGILVIKDSF